MRHILIFSVYDEKQLDFFIMSSTKRTVNSVKSGLNPIIYPYQNIFSVFLSLLALNP